MPTPYVSNYSATKAFVDAFSKAVSLEYSNHIDILSTRPMLV
jgi:short-subunit dehydrogenase